MRHHPARLVRHALAALLVLLLACVPRPAAGEEPPADALDRFLATLHDAQATADERWIRMAPQDAASGSPRLFVARLADTTVVGTLDTEGRMQACDIHDGLSTLAWRGPRASVRMQPDFRGVALAEIGAWLLIHAEGAAGVATPGRVPPPARLAALLPVPAADAVAGAPVLGYRRLPPDTPATLETRPDGTELRVPGSCLCTFDLTDGLPLRFRRLGDTPADEGIEWRRTAPPGPAERDALRAEVTAIREAAGLHGQAATSLAEMSAGAIAIALQAIEPPVLVTPREMATWWTESAALITLAATGSPTLLSLGGLLWETDADPEDRARAERVREGVATRDERDAFEWHAMRLGASTRPLFDAAFDRAVVLVRERAPWLDDPALRFTLRAVASSQASWRWTEALREAALREP